jgi:isopentenyl-diphosphate delta-isomerase
VEEMGFDCALKEAFGFIYHASLDRGMIEHEFDHVLIGTFNDLPKINKEEVEDWKWININELSVDMKENPQKYTVWFRIVFERVKEIILS